MVLTVGQWAIAGMGVRDVYLFLALVVVAAAGLHGDDPWDV